MPLDPRTPVLIGAGQVTYRAASLDDGREPVALMCDAIERAATDAGLAGVPDPDVIRVVSLFSWRYRDPARFIAERLGLSPHETGYMNDGGNSPQTLVNLTAGEIQRGALDLAILTGGEAWRTRMRARAADAPLPWPTVPEDVAPQRTLGGGLDMSHPGEVARGIVAPVQVYPMFESAIRADAAESVEEHQVKISELWARFSAVAATNPYAWVQGARTATEIRTPGPDNRMIGLPYPKYMNSNNDVDQAAALIICSVERARSLGVPEDRWVFVHAGSDCHEHTYISERWTFAETPAIELGGRAALALAGLSIDDIDLVDLYSCFPSAVAARCPVPRAGARPAAHPHRWADVRRRPWNNYVMHGIATMMNDLRQQPGANGLVWANGGFATKHAFGVYSTTPPERGFRHTSPQDEIDALPRRRFADPADAAGPTGIEAYTVMHDRAGLPETVIASCLVADDRRAWGMSSDRDLASAMCAGEWVGRPVRLSDDGTLHAA